jgi:hypothetical protein
VFPKDTALAYIRDSGTVTGDTLSLTSTNDTYLFSLAGAVAVQKEGSSTSVGIAGSFSSNAVVRDTRAFIEEATVVADLLDILAAHKGIIASLTAGGAGAPRDNGIAISGSVSVNIILSTAEAYILNSDVTLSGNSLLKAEDSSQIWAFAGAASVGGKGGFGISVAVNLIGFSNDLEVVPNQPATTKADIENSTIMITEGVLEVAAVNDNTAVDPRIIAVTGAVGAESRVAVVAGAGAAGSGFVGRQRRFVPYRPRGPVAQG